jgi:hypothetical protein
MFYINVNKHVIAANAKHGTCDPPVRFQRGKSGKQTYCQELAITDAQGNQVARVIYDPFKPVLKCGARLAIVADHGVKVIR